MYDQNRYKYYRLGQEAKKSENYDEAIKHYIKYSTYLEEKDRHIPMLWIHNLLLDQENHLEAKDYLLEYCKGCSYPHAANTLKEKAVLYQNSNFDEIYQLLILEAKKYRKKQN